MKINLTCQNCNTEFLRKPSYVLQNIRLGCKNVFCSIGCRQEYKAKNSTVEITCLECKQQFTSKKKENRKFCSQSCAASYNNKNKVTGNRRSKLEQYIEEQLRITFPDLEILFNSKEAIGSELDIFIPQLSLAFELNGIFHYEPIFGNKKLESINNNDKNKMIECAKHDIDLCIIDTTSQKYFKIDTSEKFLKIITEIIISRSGEARTPTPN